MPAVSRFADGARIAGPAAGVASAQRRHSSGPRFREEAWLPSAGVRQKMRYVRITNLSGKALKICSARHAFTRLEGLGA